LPVAPVPTTGALAAATGFCSTAHDLVRWASAHFDAGAPADGDDARVGALLRPETRRLLQREESVVERPHARRRAYGLGFEVRDIEGRRVVGHSGGFPGQLTRTWADPAGRVAVSVLTNAVDGPADAIATGLFELVATALDGTAPAAACPGATPAPSVAELDRWTGSFANLWGQTDVVRLGRRLWLIDPREADPLGGAEEVSIDGDALRPLPHAGFGPVGEPVEVLRGADGRPAAIVMGGMTSWPVEDYERERQAQLARLR
ncbi:serine hydrolase domain-containing protein, partial [Isoptericola hypogeus]